MPTENQLEQMGWELGWCNRRNLHCIIALEVEDVMSTQKRENDIEKGKQGP